MDWSSMVLATAGVFGGGTAVAHGILMKRVIMKPMETVLKRMGEYLRRAKAWDAFTFQHIQLVTQRALLIATAIWFGQEARLVTGLLAGSSFLYGAIISFWVMRRLHPSWILMTVALILTVLGLTRHRL